LVFCIEVTLIESKEVELLAFKTILILISQKPRTLW